MLIQVDHSSQFPDTSNYIIVVPSLGPDKETLLDEWFRNGYGEWLKSLPSKVAEGAHVLIYEHGLKHKNLENWEAILECGDRLVQLIKDRQISSHEQGLGFRFILLSHGFGGFIVKRAMNVIAGDDSNEELLNVLKGLVMISCPHLSLDDYSRWRKVQLLLLTRLNKIPRDFVDPNRVASLAQACKDYDNNTLPLPVLILYETLPTELKARPEKGQSAKQVLVDEMLSFLPNNSLGPPCIPVAAGHLRILHLDDFPKELELVIAFVQKYMAPDILDFATPSRTSSQFIASDTASILTNLAINESLHVPIAPLTVQQGLPQPSKVPLPYHAMPETLKIDEFEGRESVLTQLETILLPQDATATMSIAAIHGIGGIGKTSIAFNFAEHAAEHQTFDVIIWAASDESGKLVGALSTAASALELVSTSTDNEQEAAAKKLCDWLADPVTTVNSGDDADIPRAKWLLILDNVDDFKTIRNFIPRARSGSILITMRDPIIATAELPAFLEKQQREMGPVKVSHLPIEALSQDESVRLAKRLSRYSAEEDDNFHALVQHLDGIPLAIAHVAGYMSEKEVFPAEFLQMYADPSTHRALFENKSSSVIDRYEHSIATTWGLQALSTGTTLVNVIAFLDPDLIHESIFDASRSLSPELLADFPANRERYFDARNELRRRSLITRDANASTITVHRVVQATARAQMPDDVSLQTFKLSCALLLQCWPRNKDRSTQQLRNNATSAWVECNKLRPHIAKLAEHYEQMQLEITEIEARLNFVQLLMGAGWFDHDRGLFSQAQQLLHFAERVGGEYISSSIRLELHASQGAIATETNDGVVCLEHYQKFFELSKEQSSDMSNPDHQANMAEAHNELGIAKMMVGSTEELHGAQTEFESARKLLEGTLRGANHRRTRMWGLSSVNLAYALIEQRRPSEAIDILTSLSKTLSLNSVFKDQDTLVYGRLYHALGNANWDVAKKVPSKRWHQAAFDRHKIKLGESHHRTADVAVRLALHGLEQGDASAAHQFLDLCERTYSSKSCYRPELARIWHYRALIYDKQEKSEDAEKWRKDAQELYEDVLFEQRQEVMDSEPTTEDFNKLVTYWSR